MPPYRQPTPSPPPPPIEDTASSTTGASTMAIIDRTARSGGVDADAFDGTPTTTTGTLEIPPNFVPPPPPREVATGVANLGNTCYMNAALQALAHAPELCHALDAESHLRRCPVAIRNERRRRTRAREQLRATASMPSSAGSAPVHDGGAPDDVIGACAGEEAAVQSHRRSHSASSDGSAGSGGSSKSSSTRARKGGGVPLPSCVEGSGGGDDALLLPDYEYCTLCEVERLLGRVHSRPDEAPIAVGDDVDIDQDGDYTARTRTGPSSDGGVDGVTARESGPFVPEAFVSGFMTKVAPWFRRGVQEDSHEFLRLLIDAMQTSCKGARAANGSSSLLSSRSESFAYEDEEYPFRLFRGTVESNVTCSACRSTSCKIDPIEDIGLDILPVRSDFNPQVRGGAAVGGASMSSSRSTSPASNMPLADVTQALERFISSEHLDSGYKCERCGKLGKATKTSKLASIPPILTLHLKRFRYGSAKKGSGGGGAYYQTENGGGSTSGTRSSGRSGRGSSSVPQGGDYDGSNVGPSGSAKIEGHVGFGPVLDMKPYLTPQLQQTVFQKAICRLFAVVVHSGKNSHSGHYIAYVHNVTKKEWWMMDDAKVVRSSWDEVRNAEAYMLFYRVTSHPVAMQLKSIADRKEERARRVMQEIRKREEAKKADAIKSARAAAAALQDLVEKSLDDHPKVPPSATADVPLNDVTLSDVEDSTTGVSLGKRRRPAVASGVEWARVATTLSPEYLPLFTRIQEFIAENVTFSPEFFGYITEEYHRMNSKLSIARRVRNNKRIKTLLGKGPGGVYPPEDVIGGAVDIKGGILDLFHQISIMYKNTNKGSGIESFLLPKIDSGAGTPTSADIAVKEEDDKLTSKDPAVTTEFVPSSPELTIAQDNVENYDGAL
ncbi:hypothetical protein ACHAXA_004828 [Cyclostephanos tholiformis]|uniref:ubiquitinyl hydrolase 1 n=1 Tax=Cyclostephanos tholiformis TaxID=382380 RepID=A0ABD3SHA4_9STRA